MVKFKDNSSGQIYEFASAYDVAEMRKHPDYTEVIETPAAPVQEPKQSTKNKG